MVNLDQMMDWTLEDYKSWAMGYRKDLLILDNDLTIVLKKTKIFIAVDFCDLLEHCVPSMYNINFLLLKESEEADKIRNNEVARCALFYLLNNIYTFPILLLPPYLNESVSFLSACKYQLSKITKEKNRVKAELYVKTIGSLITTTDFTKKDKFENIINILRTISSDIVILVSPYFLSGIKGYPEFLRNHVTPQPGRQFPTEFKDYLEILSNVNRENSKHIAMMINIQRPKKSYQNESDALAIKCVEELNQNMRGKNVVLYTTSTYHVRKAIDAMECNKPFIYNKIQMPIIMCEKEIDNRKIPLFRDIIFFKTVLLEMISIIGLNDIDLNNFRLTTVQLNMLSLVVKRDLEIIERFLSILEGKFFNINSGNFALDIQKNIHDEFFRFIKLIDEREKTDIIFALTKLSPLQGNFNKKGITMLLELQKSVKENRFQTYIDREIANLDIEINEQIVSLDKLAKERELSSIKNDFKNDLYPPFQI